MKQFFIISAILMGSFGLMVSFGAMAEKQKEVSKDDMRCSKVRGKNLAEVKEELVDMCNLNKPFSMSLSQILNDETYLYCCHKKNK
ncbi:MAG: hypothetical protein K1X29_09140 [Bdellovibrionales bacterium]|nr:hypothetical protein [Bdellovibrionales bacterium]